MKVIIDQKEDVKNEDVKNEEIKFPCLMEACSENVDVTTIILATGKAEDGTYEGIALITPVDNWKTRVTSNWVKDFKPCKYPVTLINDTTVSSESLKSEIFNTLEIIEAEAQNNKKVSLGFEVILWRARLLKELLKKANL